MLCSNDCHTLVYGFVPHCTQATLLGNLSGQELKTMVSTSELQKTRGTFLHKLTARALIRDYEDGSLDTNEAEHEGKKAELKRFIIELSREFSILSQFTSFVAIEERDSEQTETGFTDIPKLIAEEDVDVLPYISWISPQDSYEEGWMEESDFGSPVYLKMDSEQTQDGLVGRFSCSYYEDSEEKSETEEEEDCFDGLMTESLCFCKIAHEGEILAEADGVSPHYSSMSPFCSVITQPQKDLTTNLVHQADSKSRYRRSIDVESEEIEDSEQPHWGLNQRDLKKVGSTPFFQLDSSLARSPSQPTFAAFAAAQPPRSSGLRILESFPARSQLQSSIAASAAVQPPHVIGKCLLDLLPQPQSQHAFRGFAAPRPPPPIISQSMFGSSPMQSFGPPPPTFNDHGLFGSLPTLSQSQQAFSALAAPQPPPSPPYVVQQALSFDLPPPCQAPLPPVPNKQIVVSEAHKSSGAPVFRAAKLAYRPFSEVPEQSDFGFSDSGVREEFPMTSAPTLPQAQHFKLGIPLEVGTPSPDDAPTEKPRLPPNKLQKLGKAHSEAAIQPADLSFGARQVQFAYRRRAPQRMAVLSLQLDQRFRRSAVPEALKLRWTTIFQMQHSEGYWELTTELGEFINVDVDLFANVFLKSKGIISLGVRAHADILKLVATLLVLQLMRVENLEEGKLLRTLFCMDDSSQPRPEWWEEVKRAVDWVRWADRQYPCVYSRLEFGSSWESSTRQLLGYEGLPPFSPLSGLNLQKNAAPVLVH